METQPDRGRPNLRLQAAQSVNQGLHYDVRLSVRSHADKRQGVPHHWADLERKTSAESVQLESGMGGNHTATAHWSQAILW